MIFLTYIKETGEIVAPIIQSNNLQKFDDVFGENAHIYSKIYDSLNVTADKEEALFKELLEKYKVDVEAKQLIRKEADEVIKIEY